jgi:hypothetical protein
MIQCRLTVGIDLGDVWSHSCILNEDGEVVGLGRFRTTPKAIEKWFTDLPPVRVAMEAEHIRSGSASSCRKLRHEVIVALLWGDQVGICALPSRRRRTALISRSPWFSKRGATCRAVAGRSGPGATFRSVLPQAGQNRA